MANSTDGDLRTTVCAVGGIVLGFLAVACVAVPLIALSLVDDETIKAVIATVSLPLAFTGVILALGTAYLAVAGWGSAHAITAGLLFLLAFAGAVAIAVATNSADKFLGFHQSPVHVGVVVQFSGGALGHEDWSHHRG